MKPLPKLEKQGLYDPQFEHDACGVGVVANIKGVQSHDIIEKSLQVLIKVADFLGCFIQILSGSHVSDFSCT